MLTAFKDEIHHPCFNVASKLKTKCNLATVSTADAAKSTNTVGRPENKPQT